MNNERVIAGLVPVGPTFREFVGTAESPIIVHDEQLEKRDRTARAQLRSIPFFLEFEFEEFLYDSLWHEAFQLVDHKYTPPEGTSPGGVQFPLVHIVTSDQLKPRFEQELEQEFISQADLTWDLFSTAVDQDKTYVLVTDTDAPKIPSRTPSIGRSVTDNFNGTPFEYGKLIHDFVEEHVDSELPLSDTKNLYFHRVSESHVKQGVSAETLPELFDYERAPSDSPIWQPLYYFLENELEEILDDYTAHVTGSLRSWIEHGDTEKIAKRMIATLHRCDFDTKQLSEYQQERDR